MEKIEIAVERIERGVVSFSTSVNNEIPGEVIPKPGNVRGGQLPDIKWKFSFTMPQPQEQSGRASRPLVFRFTIKPKHPEKFPLKKGASLVLNEEIKKFSASGAGNKNEVKFDFELIWKWEPGGGEIKSNKGAFIISPRMDSGSA
ncbi:MAG: hypothetical protein N3G18_00155 [Candidatus Saccharicenans sp.]|nr:hypothetical protein [Candidatus Saccharicenans sp.]